MFYTFYQVVNDSDVHSLHIFLIISLDFCYFISFVKNYPGFKIYWKRTGLWGQAILTCLEDRVIIILRFYGSLWIIEYLLYFLILNLYIIITLKHNKINDIL